MTHNKKISSLLKELKEDGASLETLNLEDKRYLLKAPKEVKAAALHIMALKKRDMANDIIYCAREHMKQCIENNRNPSPGIVLLAWNIVSGTNEVANILLNDKESLVQTNLSSNIPLTISPQTTINFD